MKTEIFEKVTNVLVDSLGIDKEEVKLESRLTKDLGAESIDFLDIIFRLEKSFDLIIPGNELFEIDDDIIKNSDFVDVKGNFTEQGICELRKKYPFLELEDVKTLTTKDIPDLYTVKSIVTYLESRI